MDASPAPAKRPQISVPHVVNILKVKIDHTYYDEFEKNCEDIHFQQKIFKFIGGISLEIPSSNVGKIQAKVDVFLFDKEIRPFTWLDFTNILLDIR